MVTKSHEPPSRGPKDHRSMRILRAGSLAQDRDGFQKTCLVGCSGGPLFWAPVYDASRDL